MIDESMTTTTNMVTTNMISIIMAILTAHVILHILITMMTALMLLMPTSITNMLVLIMIGMHQKVITITTKVA